jgi:hypothetical protein
MLAFSSIRGIKMEPYFVLCKIHPGQLIGVEAIGKGYRFYLYSYGSISCSPEQKRCYSTIKEAINAATLEAQALAA